MTVDQDSLRRKNDELVQAYKEKTRKLLQTQELYDKLKRKAMLGQMQYSNTKNLYFRTRRGFTQRRRSPRDKPVHTHPSNTGLIQEAGTSHPSSVTGAHPF